MLGVPGPIIIGDLTGDELVNIIDSTPPALGAQMAQTTIADIAAFGGAAGVNVKLPPFNAKGDRTTDDTAAIQAAYNAVPTSGGTVVWPAGTYLISATIFIKPNTTTLGYGAVVWPNTTIWNNPSFTPAPDGFVPNKQCFCNANWNVSSLTDSNISIQRLVFNNGPATGSGARGVAIFHYVTTVKVTAIRQNGGGGGPAFVACDDTLVEASSFFAVGYSAADHFSGAQNARVVNNLIVMSSSATANAIQFTGSTANNTAGTSVKLTVTGNQVYGCSVNTYAIGITETDVSSTASDIDISHNIVDLNGYPGAGGIGLYGGGGDWKIDDNLVMNTINYPAIYAQPNAYGTPSSVHVQANRIINCTHPGLALLTVIANDTTVLDNDFIGCTSLNPIAVAGDNSVVRSGRMDSGTGGARASITGSPVFFADYNLDSGYEEHSAGVQSGVGFKIGTGSTLASYLDSQTFTPSVQFGGASVGITYSSQTGAYIRIGKFIYFTVSIVMTAKGSSSGSATVVGFPFSQVGALAAPCVTIGYANMNSVTVPPTIHINSATAAIISAIGAAALTDTNFSNTTNLSFAGFVTVA